MVVFVLPYPVGVEDEGREYNSAQEKYYEEKRGCCEEEWGLL